MLIKYLLKGKNIPNSKSCDTFLTELQQLGQDVTTFHSVLVIFQMLVLVFCDVISDTLNFIHLLVHND